MERANTTSLDGTKDVDARTLESVYLDCLALYPVIAGHVTYLSDMDY